MLIKVNDSYKIVKKILDIDFEKLKLICFHHDDKYDDYLNAFYKFNDKIYKFKIFNKNVIYSICLVNNFKQSDEKDFCYYDHIFDFKYGFEINNKTYTYKEKEIIHIYVFEDFCQISYKVDYTTFNTRDYNVNCRLLLEDSEAAMFELLNNFIEDDEI